MKVCYVLVCAPLLLGTSAVAQEAPPVPELRPGHAIRIEARTVMGRIEGRFEGFTPDALVLSPQSGAPTAVPLNDLTALWVRGRATRTGLIVGGAVGAAGGAVLLSVLCGISAADDGIVGNEGFDPVCPAVGAGVGALVGGAAGAGIGAMIPTWRLRFRVPL